MADTPRTTEPSLLHIWKLVGYVDRCQQCSKPKSDMMRDWPHNMMVCSIHLVRPEFKLVQCNAI